jgi:hypothetical protein
MFQSVGRLVNAQSSGRADCQPYLLLLPRFAVVDPAWRLCIALDTHSALDGFQRLSSDQQLEMRLPKIRAAVLPVVQLSNVLVLQGDNRLELMDADFVVFRVSAAFQ